MGVGGFGGEYPRVTDVLKEAGLVDLTWVTDEHRERGTAVHTACQYLDEGTLDEESLHPDIALRLNQYKRFLEQSRCEIIRVEFEVRNDTWRYVGHPDRLVTLAGREGVLDIKGPSQSASHGPQLAAYAYAIDKKGYLARWNLYLDTDGYRLIERRDRDDWPAFLSALTLYKYRRKYGHRDA